ncbi:MAG: tetraacyldisaccharide 4'-kinase [Terriglobia bacterium]
MNPLLALFAACYRFAATARSAAYRHGWLRSRQLSRPVISIGNLTIGGTGKTPLVALVARLLADRGWRPVILTRGYGRRRGLSLTVAPAGGSRAARERAGDEPCLLAARLPGVPVVVCADRYRAGRFAEERFNPGVHLLDDGFQHLQLRRQMDIVALDATCELSDRALLPAGRMREPLAALKRAHLIVITRAELAGAAALEKLARQVNPEARIFHARTRLSGLRELRRGSIVPPEALRGKRIFTFCGIGNPKAFFLDLGRWGMTVAGRQAFRDHHVYRPRELAALARRAAAAGASALVVTEKDAMNLPESWTPPLDAFACIVDAEVGEGAAFEAELLRLLPR